MRILSAGTKAPELVSFERVFISSNVTITPPQGCRIRVVYFDNTGTTNSYLLTTDVTNNVVLGDMYWRGATAVNYEFEKDAAIKMDTESRTEISVVYIIEKV